MELPERPVVEWSDGELLQRAQDRKHPQRDDAWMEFERRFLPFVKRKLWQRLCNALSHGAVDIHEEIKDGVRKTFNRIYHRDCSEITKIPEFVMGVAAHVADEMIRELWQRMRRTVSISQEVGGNGTPTYEELLAEREGTEDIPVDPRLASFLIALKKNEPVKYQVFVLIAWSPLNQKQVAKKLGLKPWTVSRWFTCMKCFVYELLLDLDVARIAQFVRQETQDVEKCLQQIRKWIGAA